MEYVFNNKYKKVVDNAIEYLKTIKDFEHNIQHTEDVLEFCEKICEKLPEQLVFDKECLFISALWHDVGRSKINEGHEELSAEMLKSCLLENGFDEEFSEKCYKAVEHHKWNMTPSSIEGWILKDADKLGWIGLRRWSECLNNGQKLDAIAKLLPKLRNFVKNYL